MPVRNYIVNGTIRCLFQPYKDFDNNATPPDEGLPEKEEYLIEGLEVQIWKKSPLVVTQLGFGSTDDEGEFSIEFSDEILADESGDISNVFLLVYYKGTLLSQYSSDNNSILVDVLES